MALDLNLLTALDALLEEGSVTGAAQRLHLSTPAMSRTLTRIRAVTGDAILVRSGRVMVPTPYAVAVRADVHRLTAETQSVLAPRRALDLSSLERTFTLRWHDALTELAAPTLLAAVREQAPGVRLRFLAELDTDTDELRRGEIDLETAGRRPALSDIRHELVVEDSVIVVFRAGHPLATGSFTLARYAAAEHVTVSRRGHLSDPLDDALDGSGLRRRVVASAPTGAAALALVRGSDLVVTLPRLVGGPAASTSELVSRALPLAMSSMPMFLVWHGRYDGDPAHRWLRDLASAALLSVASA